MLQRLWLVCMMALLLAGPTACVTPLTSEPLAVRHFQSELVMSGRLSAKYEANYREQSISLHFDWAQTAQQTLITLSSPTGQTAATILINADGAQLTRSGEPTRSAATVDQLTVDILGWPLPVAGLRDWLQGFTDAQHRLALDHTNTSMPVVVDGWLLQYQSWQTEHNLERPKRIDLSRQTDTAGPVQLRIVVDNWTLP